MGYRKGRMSENQVKFFFFLDLFNNDVHINAKSINLNNYCVYIKVYKYIYI